MATAPTFNLSTMGTATNWNVDPKTQTVAGQLGSVLASDSPLMKQARTRATQAMNGRGLSNSSMALGAADSAMYDAAMPIATADAGTYATAAKTNADTANTFTREANNRRFQADTANFNVVANDWTAQQDFGRQTQRDATQQGYTQSNMNLANTIAKDQAAQQQGFDLAKMDKNAALTLSQMTAQQQNDLAKMAASQGYNLQTMSAQQINDLAKMQQNQQFNLQTLQQQQGFQGSQAELDRAQQTALADKNIQAEKDRLAATQANTEKNLGLQSGYDLAKLEKQTSAAKDVAAIEAQYKNLTQGSAAATSILSKMQDSINSVMANKDIADKQAAIDDIRANTVDALNLVGGIAGDLDLSEFINAVGA